MTRLIGFCGLAGAGKSFAASHLCRAHGYQRLRFAEPLKAMLRVIGLTDAHIEGELKETPSPLLCGKTPRHAMQTLGTEYGRVCIGPDFWVDAWKRQADLALSEGHSVVVDDVRFPNEAQVIWRMGGKLVRVVRKDAEPIAVVGAHASENALAPTLFDAILGNDGDASRFEMAVSALLS